METLSLVVVDPDKDFLRGLASDPRAISVIPRVAMSSKEAQSLIADRTKPLLGICVSPEIGDPLGIPIVRFARQVRPSVPVYLLSSKEQKLETEMVKSLGIPAVFQKPISLSEIVDRIQSSAFCAAKAAVVGKVDDAGLDSIASFQDQDFHPIHAKDFLSGSQSLFDVYVKLNANKYLKIVKAGEHFDVSRVQTYIKKGVEFFYIHKKAQEVYLQYCDTLTERLLQSAQIPMEVKRAQVLNLGDETLSFLEQKGVGPVNLQAAGRFVGHANFLIHKLKPQKNAVLQNFLADLGSYKHGIATTIVVSIMLEPLGFSDEKVIDVIALAAMLHDVGLIGKESVLTEEDESKMTKEQLEEFYKHPKAGSDLLAAIPLINPLIPQVVLQHHERRNRRGFPSRLGAGAITTVSELVGLADELCLKISLAAKNPTMNPIQEVLRESYDAYSLPLMQAFQKAFTRE